VGTEGIAWPWVDGVDRVDRVDRINDRQVRAGRSFNSAGDGSRTRERRQGHCCAVLPIYRRLFDRPGGSRAITPIDRCGEVTLPERLAQAAKAVVRHGGGAGRVQDVDWQIPVSSRASLEGGDSALERPSC